MAEGNFEAARLTVRLGAIAANYRTYCRLTAPTAVAAVVKADAYGMGLAKVAPALTQAGYDARACGQEHSCIPDLWRRMQGDVLIALDVDIDTLRARRGESWPAALLDRQHERLAQAYAAADLMLDSGRIDQRGVYAAVTRLLSQPARLR